VKVDKALTCCCVCRRKHTGRTGDSGSTSPPLTSRTASDFQQGLDDKLSGRKPDRHCGLGFSESTKHMSSRASEKVRHNRALRAFQERGTKP
uniref:Uncharacterized protein n=1 Tax=Neogobius melanostomus TaxID=47308 RepID=A0A8C6TS12_9GOBI